MGGFWIGYWRGVTEGALSASWLVSSSSSWQSDGLPSGMTWNRPHDNHHHSSPQQQRNDTGWTTLDIFYGTRDHLDVSQTTPLEAKQNSNSNNSNFNNHTWFSQARQDELILRLLRQKRNGYFIDLAANDAVHLSNSLALERHYGWHGLCIEPNPMYWKNLSYRACQTVGAVVGARRDEVVHFRYTAAAYGGIVGFDNGARWQREAVPQSTVPLHEIFQRYHVPREIDYLSLDVEGAESFILMALPLQEYRIKLITAERLKGEVRHFLKNHSYDFAQRLTRWGESLWVHRDYKKFMVRSSLLYCMAVM